MVSDIIRSASCLFPAGRERISFQFSQRRAVGADAVATAAFGAVERGVCHLDQLNRIARIVGERGDADADRDVVRALALR